MATLTHQPLRRLIHLFGDPDEYFSEMIHAPSFVSGGAFERWYVLSDPCPERMVWQVTGGEESSIVRAAGMLITHGGIGIDLNMGCSAPDIVRGGAGIAWMEKGRAAASGLARAVRSEIGTGPGRRLGVKMRIGVDDDFDRLLDFCLSLVESGVEVITLHPRTKTQKYSRPARHSFTARLASALPIPVYANGDVDSAASALALAATVPCAGIMIGRAAVRSPWIFRACKSAGESPSPGGRASAEAGSPAGAPRSTEHRIDHLDIARLFLAFLREGQPPEFHISRARRFFFYYCDNFSFAHHIKMRIQNAKTLEDIEGLLEGYLGEVPADRYSTLTD